MLGFSEVTYTYATAVCDWPGCNNRINLQPGPEDPCRERNELKALKNLAKRQGWDVSPGGSKSTCPYHNRKEAA